MTEKLLTQGVTHRPDPTLKDDTYLLVHRGELVGSGKIGPGQHVTAFPGTELVVSPATFKRLLRRGLAASGGAVFTYGREGF